MYSQEKGCGLQKVSLALGGGEQKGDDMSGGAGGAPAQSWRLGRMRVGSSECGGKMRLREEKSPSCCPHTISRLSTSANEQRSFPESPGSRAGREPATGAGHSSDQCRELGALSFPQAWMPHGDQGLGRREGDAGTSTLALHLVIHLLTPCSAGEQAPILQQPFSFSIPTLSRAM